MKKMTVGVFADMTGTTVKTVLHYERIGLLPEPERSQSGYRLYGAAELARMRSITQLKSQGLDLKRIAIVLGDESDDRSLRDMLTALKSELAAQRGAIDGRIARIDRLLAENPVSLGSGDAPALFEVVEDVLGPESIGAYAEAAPGLMEQQKRAMGVMGDYDWGSDHREDIAAIAEYFKAHPEDYRDALELGKRLESLADLDESDPAVDALARDAFDFCGRRPQLAKMLRKPGFSGTRGQVFDEMMDEIIPPAQRRYGRLFDDYLGKGAEHAE